MNTTAKKPRGVAFYILLVVCLSVWGYVFYEIAHGVGQPDDPFADLALPSTTAETASTATPIRSGPVVTYHGDFRDPFARPAGLFARKAAAPRVSKPAKPAPPAPPPLALSGVVDGTALLQGEDGSVFVARAGESAGSVRVVSVKRDQVVIRFQGRAHTLRLSR